MVGLGQWGPGLPVRATLSSPGLGQVPPVQIGVLWIEQPAPPATPVEGNLLVARGEMAASDQVTWLLARLSWGLRAVASRPADPHRLSPPPGLSPPTPFFLGRTRAGGDENLGRFKFLILPGEQRLTQPGWERLPRRGHVGGLSAEGLAEGGGPGQWGLGPSGTRAHASQSPRLSAGGQWGLRRFHSARSSGGRLRAGKACRLLTGRRRVPSKGSLGRPSLELPCTSRLAPRLAAGGRGEDLPLMTGRGSQGLCKTLPLDVRPGASTRLSPQAWVTSRALSAAVIGEDERVLGRWPLATANTA